VHAHCAGLDKVPVVVLVLEGGHNTLKTAHEAIETKTPVLVFAGSGRAADFIVKAYEKQLVTSSSAMAEKSSGACFVFD